VLRTPFGFMRCGQSSGGSATYFLPFCCLFFLSAFYNALLNFQIRFGYLAS
jgi:hypothetical protein